MEHKPSKSAQKREARAVDALAVRLIELGERELATVPLDEALRELVREARDQGSRSAARRQRLYLAKRLRATDLAPIVAACDRLSAGARAETRRFHEAETWRDRLLAEPGALAELEAQLGRELPALAALLGGRSDSLALPARRRLGRELFRALHAELADDMQPPAAKG